MFQAVALDTVDSCLQGFSGAILAYGQTNSGKTWTVTGGEGEEEQGLAPRAIGHLFRGIQDAETSGLSVRYEVSVGRVKSTTAAVGFSVWTRLVPRDRVACVLQGIAHAILVVFVSFFRSWQFADSVVTTRLGIVVFSLAFSRYGHPTSRCTRIACTTF